MANLFAQMKANADKISKAKQEKYLKFHDFYSAIFKSVSLHEAEFNGESSKSIKVEYVPLLKSDKEDAFEVQGFKAEVAGFTKYAFYQINEDSFKKVISLLEGCTKFSSSDLEDISDIDELENYFGEVTKVLSLNVMKLQNQIPSDKVGKLSEAGFIFDNVFAYETKLISGKLREDKFSFKQLSKHVKSTTVVVEHDLDSLLDSFDI